MARKESDPAEEFGMTVGNPISFFQLITKNTPYSYQVDILKSHSKRLSVRAGRQVGKTEVIALKALHYAITRPGKVILILSPTMRQSQILFNKIDSYIQINPYIYDLIERKTQTFIKFYNTSEIHSLPSGETGDTIRGFSPSLIIIDEAAYVKDKVFVSIEPSLGATQGDIILISTPFGKRGRFYETFNPKGSQRYETYHIRAKDCPKIDSEFLQEQRETLTAMEYLQEFEGEFVEEADAYFPYSLIMNCLKDEKLVHKEEQPDPVHKNYYLGVDPARYGMDESAYAIIEVTQDLKVEILKFIATAKKPTTDVMGRVKELNLTYQFKQIFIDETGLGAGAADVLAESGLPIVPITFSEKSKGEMFSNLKLLMEKQKISFSTEEQKFLMQLSSIQYQYSSAGNVKVYHPDRSHDDLVCALVLACQSVKPGDGLLGPHRMGAVKRRW
jgi:hypothetical protein